MRNLFLLLFVCCGAAAADDYKVVTHVSKATLDAARDAAPQDRVSDQPVVHVESAEGRLGIGLVHRPALEAGGPVVGIQHHRQSEVYRVLEGRGVLVTAPSMDDAEPFDADGDIVRTLTGPSDAGVIVAPADERSIAAGDVVIIPAGLAHGFREIQEPITYLVVRIDPDRLVELK